MKMRELIAGILIIAAPWMGIGHIVYAFRHPEMTDTQRFLHTKDAMFFR